ncbi:hypothetical protein DFH06DRAFT_1198821 [Mycena polygramma]|nr:hypothetical protein DFH06DRAFT_1242981 [Mycena polygramma]KAJ7656947.1 hypothetical protein DFH06DRAFT_1198821 [Mycena polygramma]
MAPKSKPEAKAVTGPSQELISRIEHLRSLLNNLPESLPENPADSPYRFYLDPDETKDRGYLGELGHALEVSFATHLRPVQFLQRGSCLDPLPVLLKTTVKQMPSRDREIFREAWLERLINAAVAAGAKAPPRGVKRKAQEEPTASAEPSVTVTSRSLPPTIPSTSSSRLPPGPIASSSRNTPIGNPKQSTLQFARATKEDVQRYWTNAADAGAEKRKRLVADKERRGDRENAPKDVPDKRNATKILMNGAAAIAGTSAIGDVADVSRPATQDFEACLLVPPLPLGSHCRCGDSKRLVCRIGCEGPPTLPSAALCRPWKHPPSRNTVEVACQRRTKVHGPRPQERTQSANPRWQRTRWRPRRVPRGL